MTTLYLIGAGVAILGFVIWLALRGARREGGAKQRADDIALAKDAEASIHEVQAETRDSEETRKRLQKGDF